ncbi:MAG: ATP-binding cassette domain-containing protein [Parachlamydiaceae bacterium]|nr:ATP-binding cassette domain-containing protein [Parachlamydiaceae bacterium]
MANKGIVVEDLWKAYGTTQVLKGLNLTVNEGETVVILGRSGVGKSVLLRQILGIELPDRGHVDVNGIRISSLSQSKRYEAVKSMGMLFQGSALFDSMNVGENVAFYLRQHEKQLSEKEILDRVAKALKMVNLEGMESKMPSDLSGGMRKRAALARLIVYRPKIVLYDEPTTGLDPITSHQINELIISTQEELKATSIVVTHDIKSAFEVGDWIAFHHEGKIYKMARKDDFLKIDDPVIKDFLKNAILTSDIMKENSKKNHSSNGNTAPH